MSPRDQLNRLMKDQSLYTGIAWLVWMILGSLLEVGWTVDYSVTAGLAVLTAIRSFYFCQVYWRADLNHEGGDEPGEGTVDALEDSTSLATVFETVSVWTTPLGYTLVKLVGSESRVAHAFAAAVLGGIAIGAAYMRVFPLSSPGGG